eukprot:5725137-Pleurochrysis_carterae.AAC.2
MQIYRACSMDTCILVRLAVTRCSAASALQGFHSCSQRRASSPAAGAPCGCQILLCASRAALGAFDRTCSQISEGGPKLVYLERGRQW